MYEIWGFRWHSLTPVTVLCAPVFPECLQMNMVLFVLLNHLELERVCVVVLIVQ